MSTTKDNAAKNFKKLGEYTDTEGDGVVPGLNFLSFSPTWWEFSKRLFAVSVLSSWVKMMFLVVLQHSTRITKRAQRRDRIQPEGQWWAVLYCRRHQLLRQYQYPIPLLRHPSCRMRDFVKLRGTLRIQMVGTVVGKVSLIMEVRKRWMRSSKAIRVRHQTELDHRSTGELINSSNHTKSL